MIALCSENYKVVAHALVAVAHAMCTHQAASQPVTLPYLGTLLGTSQFQACGRDVAPVWQAWTGSALIAGRSSH